MVVRKWIRTEQELVRPYERFCACVCAFFCHLAVTNHVSKIECEIMADQCLFVNMLSVSKVPMSCEHAWLINSMNNMSFTFVSWNCHKGIPSIRVHQTLVVTESEITAKRMRRHLFMIWVRIKAGRRHELDEGAGNRGLEDAKIWNLPCMCTVSSSNWCKQCTFFCKECRRMTKESHVTLAHYHVFLI